MELDLQSQLRGYEGSEVWLTLTDGEVMLAKVISASKEPQHVVVDILSTDQPERYERMRGNHLESSWAIPLGLILSVTPRGITGPHSS